MPTIEQLDKQLKRLSEVSSIEKPNLFSFYNNAYNVTDEQKNKVETILLQLVEYAHQKTCDDFALDAQARLISQGIFIPLSDLKQFHIEITYFIKNKW